MDVTERVAHSQILKRLPERLWPWRRRAANGAPAEARAWDTCFASESGPLHEALALEQRQKQLLETMVAGLSHRVNNGLHGILAHAECLGRNTSPTHEKNLQGVMRSAQGLSGLTRDLARAACDIPTSPAPHDLAELLSGWVKPLEELCPTGVQLHVERTSELVSVSVDAALLWEALGHVMRNAIEAYEGRSGTIEVRMGSWAGSEHLLTHARPVANIRPGNYGYVEVLDHAAGIEPAHLARVFDPFFSTKFIGRGLGLPMVTNLMRAMQGLVLLDSTKGVGTRVRLLMPFALVTPRDHTGIRRTTPADGTPALA